MELWNILDLYLNGGFMGVFMCVLHVDYTKILKYIKTNMDNIFTI